jgi:hypothetical protein
MMKELFEIVLEEDFPAGEGYEPIVNKQFSLILSESKGKYKR